MDTLANLLLGLSVALAPKALLFCFIGVTIGTLVGVLPGIGALAAISMSLPITFYLEPTFALIMLAGIFYGSQYGGSVASILLNLPGTPASAVTCIDGYPMTRQGRAGVALLVTTLTSFVGSSFATLLLIFMAPALGEVALNFGSPEYFSIMLLGLVSASGLSIGSPLKGLAMVAIGLLLGLVGVDASSGTFRFTFGFVQLTDGVSLVALAMGLFGITEILANVTQKQQFVVNPRSITLRSMMPSRDDLRRSVMPALRGSILGSWIGILPGTGASIAAFISYALEKRIARQPERFGNGAIEGVAAPEAANNAAVQSAFIPTLSLGIPGDAIMAIVLGAMMIHGIVPGPQFITQHSTVFWGLVVSFWVGNILLLILNIPLIGVWVRIVTIPYRILYPCIMFFICIGVYSVQNSTFDVIVALVIGVSGYGLVQLHYPPAPLLLGFILGPLMEGEFVRSMMVSRGNPLVFFERPISAGLLVATALLLVLAFRRQVAGAIKRFRPITKAEVERPSD